jgi:murein DD-endopeptidase MepM/ murein hydrolase activator NlpD
MIFLPVKDGYITADFNDHVARGQSGSFGYDIGSHEKDAPIYSSFQGIVVSASETPTFGNRVWIHITSGPYKGLFCVSAHMKSICEDIEEGNMVNESKQLGIMGTTGMSEAVHLHRELREGTGKSDKSVRWPELEMAMPCKNKKT